MVDVLTNQPHEKQVEGNAPMQKKKWFGNGLNHESRPNATRLQ